MKKVLRNNRSKGRKVQNKGAISIVAVFVGTFFLTITIGALVLAGMAYGGNDDSDGSETSEEPVKRITFSEKITDSDGDQAADGEDTLDAGDADLEAETGVDAGEENSEDASVSEGEITDDTVEGETYISGAKWEYSIQTANPDCMRLAFAGDILFDPGYAIMNSIRQKGGVEGVFGSGLLADMRNADVMVVNNEFPYSNRGVPTEGKTFTFRADPSSANLLNDMGVDVATIANNHTYDYGESALLDTLDALDNAGVARIGAGANIEEASNPVYYNAENGLKVAIIAATEIERLDNPDTKGATENSPGVFRCLDISRLQSRIREAKAEGAFVIVCIHWGTENQEEIDWWQQKQGPEIVEAGADLIVGGHPHILQKIGYIGSVPVVYSLGNYLFNSKTLDTGLLQVEVHNDHSMNLRFVPAIQSGCTVYEATDVEKARILQHLRDISPGVSIDEDGNIQ
ncbi:MAG: CapA family protein [Butyrivibrio sp.]|nr:CapA family protein [Butyrivibrio sp.]